MGVNNQNVFVGAPDQLTTGAIHRAPLATPLPTTAVAALNAGFATADPGYVDEGGLTVSPSRATTPIRDWSLKTIRNVLQSFDGTLAWSHLELSEYAMKNFAGDSKVSATAANGSHGNQLSMALSGDDLPHYSWVFNMKDGLMRARVVVPDGQVTSQGDIAFLASTAIKLPVVLSTYPDSSGNSIYIYTDDGLLTA